MVRDKHLIDGSGRRVCAGWAKALLANLMVVVMLSSAVMMPASSAHASMDDSAIGCAMDDQANDDPGGAGLPVQDLAHGFGHCCPLPMLVQPAVSQIWAGVTYPVSDDMPAENRVGGIFSTPPYKPPRLHS